MTPEQIGLVQDSYRPVIKLGPVAAEVFYNNLFQIDPTLKSLFRSDMSAQGHKLLNALGFVVENLHTPDRIVPTVQALGVRHVGYGVTRTHYATVGHALINTLAQALGDKFDLATREAWMAAYQLLTDVMCDAAYGQSHAVFV